jgi:hypothetical protein
MKNIIVFCFIFCCSSSLWAASVSDKVVAYLFSQNYLEADKVFSNRRVVLVDRQDGLGVVIGTWDVPNVSPPDSLPSDEDTLVLLQEFEVAKEAARQAAKPAERKAYENQFFTLIEELYNATGVTNQVTPKLGFPEIRELIDTVQASDPMAAVNYSLELLSIDAALKRYSLLWWDDAIQHDIVP